MKVNESVKEVLAYAATIVIAIVMFAMLFSLAGCATTYEVEIGGNRFKSTSYREFRHLRVVYGGFMLEASGVTDDTAEAVTSVVNTLTDNVAETGQMWLMGGPLLDMTGRPRSATPAELAAQARVLENR